MIIGAGDVEPHIHNYWLECDYCYIAFYPSLIHRLKLKHHHLINLQVQWVSNAIFVSLTQDIPSQIKLPPYIYIIYSCLMDIRYA